MVLRPAVLIVGVAVRAACASRMATAPEESRSRPDNPCTNERSKGFAICEPKIFARFRVRSFSRGPPGLSVSDLLRE
jgi:hypothetical protein